MYHLIVRQIIRSSFLGLNKGDYRKATKLMAEDCHYHFVGRHALGGHRRSRALIEAWFQRFLRILPGFQFTPVNILVTGWPWRTCISVQLNVSWKLPDGQPYGNVALQAITLRWFKAASILTVDDSQRVAELLELLGRKYGVAEALAPPIEG